MIKADALADEILRAQFQSKQRSAKRFIRHKISHLPDKLKWIIHSMGFQVTHHQFRETHFILHPANG